VVAFGTTITAGHNEISVEEVQNTDDDASGSLLRGIVEL
jgi:hypothetical protein